jgi:hypothetical protein
MNAINGSKNFLTVTYTGHLGGNVGSSTAGLTASQTAGDTVNFSSGVINFAGTTDYGFALSFSALTPTLQLGTGNFYHSFTGSGTGTFHLTPAIVPEPGSLTIVGALLSTFVGAGFLRRRSRAFLAQLF